LIFSRTL